MNPMEAISSVFGNYTNFDGRATRSEYWWFTLFSSVLMVIVVLLMAAVPVLGAILAVLAGLAMFLPSLAVLVRRLHDTNRSAKSLFWLTPPIYVIGAWVLLIILIRPGTQGPNRYGSDPRSSPPAH